MPAASWTVRRSGSAKRAAPKTVLLVARRAASGPATMPVTPVRRMRLPDKPGGGVVAISCSRPQSEGPSETPASSEHRSPHGDRVHARAGGGALRAARLLREAPESRDGSGAGAVA